MEVTTNMLDVSRFQDRIAAADAARSAANKHEEAKELQAALSNWRSAPLSDVPSESLHLQDAPRLTEARLQAQERLIDVQLILGKHTELVGDLYTLTEENQLREHFWRQLILALHRSDGHHGLW
ncbi:MULTISPECIES: AfsR/SARP family transcriptional regulator [unclassified Amycolatopsis]|uniref:AfsR/SARP family transcriptional regulator n=1 Tax=unclassified Amycolatopsis TaxID=2618356 RepID=UPI001F1F530F|nr:MULTISPECIES: AfsR/SARP family transcriptional regulator [unclassified Amycolatopsis]